MRIGYFELSGNLFLAPMAGITDTPFRKICRKLGADYSVSEMASANPQLWETRKSIKRVHWDKDEFPKTVQLLGANAQDLAFAAKYHAERGADIIDINMGCPARKVCNKWAGSALLQHENLVAEILREVVKAVDVPVTLKFRTGWSRNDKNAVKVAKIAEDAGIAMLILHGRTREDGYSGKAEYDTIAEVKSSVQIPVAANGDIDSPEKAAAVLKYTNADALMIGRAAQGHPWIFREIKHYLHTNEKLPEIDVNEIKSVVVEHLQLHYEFYGERAGVRTARKHIAWYIKDLPDAENFRSIINRIETSEEQIRAVEDFIENSNSINFAKRVK